MADMNGASDKLKNQAEEVKSEAQEAAQKAAEELKEVGRELRKRADEVRQEAVKLLHNAAATIRKEVHESKADDTLKENADKLAKGLEKTAHYLNARTIEQMGEEATTVVRQNPWRMLAMVFIVGIIIGIILRKGD